MGPVEQWAHHVGVPGMPNASRDVASSGSGPFVVPVPCQSAFSDLVSQDELMGPAGVDRNSGLGVEEPTRAGRGEN